MLNPKFTCLKCFSKSTIESSQTVKFVVNPTVMPLAKLASTTDCNIFLNPGVIKVSPPIKCKYRMFSHWRKSVINLSSNIGSSHQLALGT